MIKNLRLKNFRQFDDYSIDLDSELVIIQGNNTLGKSSILEAISLITNQASPFTNKAEEMINYKSNDLYFRIDIDKKDEDGDINNLAIFQDLKLKQFYKNGSKTTRKKFAEGLASTIFSPEQIEQLMQSSSKRREYLNGIISQTNFEYSDSVNMLSKVLRQRNAYLKRLAKKFYESGYIDTEDKQLLYWSEKFALHSAEVSATRATFIDELRNNDFHIEFEPSIPITTLVQVDQLFHSHLNALVTNLRKDIATGFTNSGAHRDDWSIYSDKDIKKFGSRGEKRMAISRMIFKNQELLSEILGFYPTLLLDDISSELDATNTAKILLDSIKPNQQIIISAITLDGFPKEIVQNAKVIEL